MEKIIRSVRDLNVYKMAMDTAMEIFTVSQSFPSAEKFSLTDQMRRSSRSVCANLAEAWRKRKYIAAFHSKLSDCTSEAAETQVWLEFAVKCCYIKSDVFSRLDNKYEQIFAMLTVMDRRAEKFCR